MKRPAVPFLMQPAEHRAELCRILALGLVRLLTCPQSSLVHIESPWG